MGEVRVAIAAIVVAGCGRIGFDELSSPTGAAGADVELVAAGELFTCAIRSDATVWCWGDNTYGEIGDTTGMPHPLPVQIAGLSGATAIAAGDGFACAIVGDGSVWCWGDDELGELGDGVEGSSVNATPARVAGLTARATRLSAGSNYACALFDDGTAACWGYNDQNEITGVIGGVQPATPVPLDHIVQLAAGTYHMMALRDDGTVWTWGYAENGRLGRGDDDSTDPAPIDGFSALAIAASDSSCAITPGGEYSCWGYNDAGQLGDGTTDVEAHVPNPPSALGGVTALAMGGSHTCALLADQTVQCWGSNEYGELGANDRLYRSLPVAAAVSDVVSLSASSGHTCAVRSDGAVLCWGRGSNGQLGDGTLAAFTPHEVAIPSPVTALALGDHHTCAAGAGVLYCWGQGEDGELGDGAFTSHAQPTAVTFSAVQAIAAGQRHTCATDGAHMAWCWGDNSDGELGDSGVETATGAPVQVQSGSTFDSLTAGFDFTCGMAGSAASCWGRGAAGELGDGDTGEQATPVPTTPIAGLQMVAAGGDDACEVGTAGAMFCWGYNNNGEDGDGSILELDTPTAVCSDVSDGTAAGMCNALVASGGTTIATRGEHTCAAMINHKVLCWGVGDDGQLGDGNFQSTITPVIAQGVTAGGNNIAVGDEASCTPTMLPGAVCWGDNTFGQLGNGTSIGAGTAQPVPGVNVVEIEMGAEHVCAIDSNHALWCWGDNAHGEQGTGTFSRALTPTIVQFP